MLSSASISYYFPSNCVSNLCRLMRIAYLPRHNNIDFISKGHFYKSSIPDGRMPLYIGTRRNNGFPELVTEGFGDRMVGDAYSDGGVLATNPKRNFRSRRKDPRDGTRPTGKHTC